MRSNSNQSAADKVSASRKLAFALVIALLAALSLDGVCSAASVLLRDRDISNAACITRESHDGAVAHPLEQMQTLLGVSYSLIRFDLSRLPEGKMITSAYLHLNRIDGGGEIGVWRCLRPWTNDATWLTTGVKGAKPWLVPGARGNAADKAWLPTSTANAAQGILTFDVLEDVEAWLTRSNNYGWVIGMVSGGSCSFHGPEAPNRNVRPRLVISFAPYPESEPAE